MKKNIQLMTFGENLQEVEDYLMFNAPSLVIKKFGYENGFYIVGGKCNKEDYKHLKELKDVHFQ